MWMVDGVTKEIWAGNKNGTTFITMVEYKNKFGNGSNTKSTPVPPFPIPPLKMPRKTMATIKARKRNTHSTNMDIHFYYCVHGIEAIPWVCACELYENIVLVNIKQQYMMRRIPA